MTHPTKDELDSDYAWWSEMKELEDEPMRCKICFSETCKGHPNFEVAPPVSWAELEAKCLAEYTAAEYSKNATNALKSLRKK